MLPTRHLPPARLAAPAHRIRRTETSTIAEPEKTLTGPALVVSLPVFPFGLLGWVSIWIPGEPQNRHVHSDEGGSITVIVMST